MKMSAIECVLMNEVSLWDHVRTWPTRRWCKNHTTLSSMLFSGPLELEYQVIIPMCSAERIWTYRILAHISNPEIQPSPIFHRQWISEHSANFLYFTSIFSLENTHENIVLKTTLSICTCYHLCIERDKNQLNKATLNNITCNFLSLFQKHTKVHRYT